MINIKHTHNSFVLKEVFIFSPNPLLIRWNSLNRKTQEIIDCCIHDSSLFVESFDDDDYIKEDIDAEYYEDLYEDYND